jgi:hypothetical protein
VPAPQQQPLFPEPHVKVTYDPSEGCFVAKCACGKKLASSFNKTTCLSSGLELAQRHTCPVGQTDRIPY